MFRHTTKSLADRQLAYERPAHTMLRRRLPRFTRQRHLKTTPLECRRPQHVVCGRRTAYNPGSDPTMPPLKVGRVAFPGYTETRNAIRLVGLLLLYSSNAVSFFERIVMLVQYRPVVKMLACMCLLTNNQPDQRGRAVKEYYSEDLTFSGTIAYSRTGIYYLYNEEHFRSPGVQESCQK